MSAQHHPLIPKMPQDGRSSQDESDQLKLANHYLRVALDQVREGVLLFDAGPLDSTGPRVIYCNLPSTSLIGVTPEKGLRGLHAIDLVSSDSEGETLLRAFRDAASAGSSEVVVGLQTYYEKGAQPCVWRVKALHNGVKQLLNFTVTIQPEKSPAAPEPLVEAASTRADDLEIQSERLRVENLAAMAQGIAHDVNNLLGPITAQLSLIQPSVDPNSELGQALDLIMASVRRAGQFTSQVVKAAKSRPAEKCPTDLTEIVRETARLAQAGTNVKVHLRVADNLPPAMCDGVKISQVMQNLVMNGIQAMPKGGHMDVEMQTVEVRYGQDAQLKPGCYLEVRVRDRGVGISPDNLSRLFKESFTTKSDGNGIGLTTCKRIVEDHGGVIRVDSALGVGTEFRVCIPISSNEAAPAVVPPAVRAVSKGLISGKGSVLIVDDEIAIRTIAATILKRCGYKVLECESGEAAVKSYIYMARSSEPLDAVIMDLTLAGGMEGMEAAAGIWAFDSAAKIIVSSGSVTQDVQRTFSDKGFAATLPKPYEAGELSQVVHSVIGQVAATLSE